MKNAFIKSLTELMELNDDVIVVSADMGFSVFEDIQKRFPDRFINTGITEQASISYSAGLSFLGYKVYFFAQAAFSTMRCFEQVRLDVAYHNANVKIIGYNAGFSLNQLGASHFSIEDMALMRTIPRMRIFAPTDPLEMDWIIKESYKTNGPLYIRFSKTGGKVIFNENTAFSLNKALPIYKGETKCIIATGGMLETAFEVANELKQSGTNISLYSFPCVKPIDVETIIDISNSHDYIYTIEEHSIVGGLGSAVAEVLANIEGKRARLIRIGADDEFTSVSGSLDYLLDINNLSKEKIKNLIAK